MAIFSTLAGAQAKTDATHSSIASGSKSLTVPTVIQLFTDYPFPLTIDTAQYHAAATTAGTSNSTTGLLPMTVPPSYAALHYTAVQCQTAAQLKELSSEQQRGLRQAKKTITVATPDLGVWNCRISTTTAPSTNTGTKDTSTTSTSGATSATTDSSATSTQSTTPKDTSLLSVIAQRCRGTPFHTFCMVVDLSKVENVEPSITKMQEALVRFLISSSNSKKDTNDDPTTTENKTKATNTDVRTTTLYQLQIAQFGLGPNDTASKQAMTKVEPDIADKNVTIALQICVKLPYNTSDFQEYRDQQAISLIVYHLRKYAAALSASLVFVSGVVPPVGRGNSSSGNNKDSNTTSNDISLSPSKNTELQDSSSSSSFALLQEQPTVPVQQLPIIWKELAFGKAVWKPEVCPEIYEDLNIPIPSSNLDEASSADDIASPDDGAVDDSVIKTPTNISTHSLIYGPGSHNEELIESVLLRNANYPGHWDAAKESVWKILPKEDPTSAIDVATTTSKNKKGAANTIRPGDEWWLSELRESIAIPDAMKTPPPKKSSDSSTATKTPNDAAVSSFFEDLLK
jgi:hypothetical protein